MSDEPEAAVEIENVEEEDTSDVDAQADESPNENGDATDAPLTSDDVAQEEGENDDAEAAEAKPEEEPAIKIDVKELIKGRVMLPGLNAEMWLPSHDALLDEFITDSRQLLCVYMDPLTGLQCSFDLPSLNTIQEVAYFLRPAKSDGVALDADSFITTVQFGTVVGSQMESLLRIMQNVFAPLFFENKNWPDSVRNDFASQLHRFLASLTDTRWKLDNKTVLYIPIECKKLDIQDAARDKELVQRLEAIVIHWTRQIKEVLTSQDTLELSENAGPLDEIEFWKNRCDDLSGISGQLDKAGVKKIADILEIAKSSYVTPFLRLSSQIKESTKQAQSNLRFLMVLREPCYDLAESEAKDVPVKIPKIINLIRMVWVNSEYYKSRERLISIFRKLSNEVIRICCRDISLDRIFDGYITSSMQMLHDAIRCCESYKEIYDRTAKLHHKFSEIGWTLDKSSIFAQIDAFIQRCKDLLEVCECQMHFARWEEGEKKDLPQFGGARGMEIERSVREIEASFANCLVQLKSVKRTILDVKNTAWHDEYNKFRSNVKDLEVAMQNVINTAFETVATVEQGVELLDVFMHLATRETIGRTIEKRTVDVFNLFREEMETVKRELQQRSAGASIVLPVLTYHPKYGGMAHWSRMLKKRLQRSMMILDRGHHFLPHTAIGDETRTLYQQLTTGMDDFHRKTFYEWSQALDREPLRLLDIPLMCRSTEKQGLIDSNFNRSVLKSLAEYKFWERMMSENEMPQIQELLLRESELIVLREHVLLVVRDYNRIVSMLNPDERGLFRDRIRFLDKKIQPGLTKLTWASKGVSDFFIQDCRVHASKLQQKVDEYKSANAMISRNCVRISESLFVLIDSKIIYEDQMFDKDQSTHRQRTKEQVTRIYEEIIEIMRRTFETFRNDPNEVQSYWVKYTEKMDLMCEEAFRLNAKASLQELSKALNGDGKSGPNPVFRVRVILDRDHIDYQPTLQQLWTMVSAVHSHIVECAVGLPRLQELLTKRRVTKPPIHEVLTRDGDCEKIQKQILTALDKNSTALQDYLTVWDPFREIWELDKDAFIRRYRQMNPPVANFEGDIQRYVEISNNVDSQETQTQKDFVQLDCSLLKSAILSHCQEWQGKFMNLLLELAIDELKDVYNYLRSNAQKVSRPPQTLEELGLSLALWDQLHSNLAATQQRFTPLTEQFLILEKREVPVPNETKYMYDHLEEEWVNFQQVLTESEQMLKKHKEKFKTNLMQQSDEFKKQCSVMLSEFVTNGPFTSKMSPNDALAAIQLLKQQLAQLKATEAEIKHGLSIFKIEQAASKELATLEHDLEAIEQIWGLALEWDTNWLQWKTGRFADLQTTEMESQSQNSFKRLQKLSRELREKNWEIVETTKGKVDQFRRTMPLIQDLKNPAMRSRHWNQIRNELNIQFDESSDDFTLEKIIEYQFDQHDVYIKDVSSAATKELAIESGLQKITDIWNQTDLDIVPYKDKGHFKVRSTDEVFQTLEDNQVQLATMKASRFVKAFEQDVDKWERTLSRIMEAIEMLLLVQRQWLYLEQIFLGEDIRKQLPKESKDFDDINLAWKNITSKISKDRNALRATHQDRLLETMQQMNTKLEEIQKSLDMYLETKRQAFPRFYFVSNDDLLEILGQGKNPEAVQVHLKKCFDNIKSLKLEKSNMGRTEIHGMFSSEQEFVPFKPLPIEGPVESWLTDVERWMRSTLRDLLKDTRNGLKKSLMKRDKWVRDWPGQLCITSSQIQWTADAAKAIQQCKELNDKKPLKTLKRKEIVILNKFSEAIRGQLTKMQRAKIVALVTIEVHQRDIIDKLVKANVNDPQSFEWISQLRFYWDKEIDDCIVRQTSSVFPYGYEYLGNSGRLVITALTDRCYITLTTALFLHRGGSPKGPAGTGKTETTKDLGKALGYFVIVINCSEGLDYKSMGRMFSGLAQTGAWGCFDEFNRINVEVLSVVAQQIMSILEALSAGSKRFVFEGQEINLRESCGLFITMNPGYSGRTELPDNLKSMFRPIAMVVPDSTVIAEITLYGEGFGNTKVLAKKVFTLYSLAQQQLSKQDHYDFGLRALVSVLRYAGRKKRQNPTLSDEEILLLSMKDMNVPKMTSIDAPLFNAIVQDLFPGVEAPTVDYTVMKGAIEKELQANGLQATSYAVQKVIQLYETKNSRHSTMIVGKTQSGKTVTWRTLQSTLTRLNRETNATGNAGAGGAEQQVYQKVTEYPLNPKSISLGELYGEFDLGSNEWSDGVLSSIMRTVCADDKPDEKWIVFDGPVDTLWIESMNSLMDDNKILTLINGERIGMPEQVSLLFEVEDLAVASPATVSRAGMVYNDYNDLGWKPYVDSWLQRRLEKCENKTDRQTISEEFRRLFDKYVDKMLQFVRKNCSELIPIAELNGIQSLCRLLDCLVTPENGVDLQNDADNFTRALELWFMFCLLWSVCASVNEEGRAKIDTFVREMEGTFPNKDTIFEYFVEPKTKTWNHWEEKLRTSSWKYSHSTPFYKLIVPTVDTARYMFLCHTLLSANLPALLVGPVGTGKTSVAQMALAQFDPRLFSILTVNMSAQTSSNNVQQFIESRVEKRTKGIFVPIGGKKLLTFCDDFNMPAKDTFGSQPPLELIRQWIDYGFWYDRQNQTAKYVRDMYLLAAMGPPGGGRMQISRRLQSRFNLINMTFPQESQIKRIFGTLIGMKLQEFEEEIKLLGDVMTDATIQMYQAVTQRFLPTPTRIHYLFNLRDISRVFQGLLRCDKNYHDTKPLMTRLWVHECFRVFSDRLIDQQDTEAFVQILAEKLGALFEQTFHNLCPGKVPPIFGDYVNPDRIYEDIKDMDKLKAYMNGQLNEYNNAPGYVRMNLVLFRDAVEHISRIVRVIRQPRGNMLLVGIGGSGRQSLTRLAAFMCDYVTFQIEVSKHYRKQEFRDDIKKLYSQCGVEQKETVFLFTDQQIVDESFVEDLNNILSSGEVPGLYKPEEFEEVKSRLADEAKKEGLQDESNQSLFNFLVERVRANLHVVLCMSPVGEAFRNRLRMYPALVNCTTIDWFSEWPQDALLEVAEKYVAEIQFRNDAEEKLKPSIATVFSVMQKSVSDYSKRMLVEMRRTNYVTPTNYLELVSGYRNLLYKKRQEIGDAANKLRNGLSKLDDTREKVQVMSKELEVARVQIQKFQKECDEYLIVLVQQKREADEQQKSVAQTSEKIGVEEQRCKQMADLAQADLAEALPALEEAQHALEALNKKDLGEVKSYTKPPPLVERVLEAVMILRGAEPTWAEAKRQLGESNFIKQLVNFDKDNISDRTLAKIGKYCAQEDFMPETVGKVSLAAKSLCMWVRAMELYGRLYRVVEPKRQRLNQAMATLKEKQDMLAQAKAKLAEIEAKMEQLQMQYQEKLTQKEELNKKANYLESMLERAQQLVSNLAGEKVRWEQTVMTLDEEMSYLPGDCLIAAAFVSYMGPFITAYRNEIVLQRWIPELRKLGIPNNPEFDFCSFMVKATQVRDWNLQGLPADQFSTENGVIVTRGSKWPLMIDPQGQALKWIKAMEGQRNLRILDLQQSNYMQQMEVAVQYGHPVLITNVGERLDPSLDPILNRALIRIGGALIIKLGDKEIEYNFDFRLYITTKLNNPRFSPELSSKTTIVNFAIKEEGLENQLLALVVRKERPDLEEQKDGLVLNIAAGRKKLAELEDTILRLLNESKGSLLDDEELVSTLQTSKQTSQEVTEQLAVAEQTEKQIDSARNGYRSSALRASILFFVLNEMNKVDPMYQFSLDAYVDLFTFSIEKSQRSPKLENRIQNVNDFHTYAVYKYACRALFERHKLLFSLQMCAKILESAGKLNVEEYFFFLRGGIVLDREQQFENPASSWLPEPAWDNITELDKLANFHGLVTSFEQYGRDWNIWYTSGEPETQPLPGEWDNVCNELQKMLIVRSLRQDRVQFCASSFIVNNLGSRFVEPPVLEMRQVFEDSSARTPLIFVLSPGVDPTSALQQLAESQNMMNRFHPLSLGQGQAPIATRLIRQGAKEGNWVYLANCHLSLSWMPQLDKIVEELIQQDDRGELHKDFRLWLSSSPNPEFPIAILQAGIKLTTEPPKGLKQNMKRLYHLITESQFSACKKQDKYKKLLFSLCFFHSVLLERKKFLQLGWNIMYEFNDSDFIVSENLLSSYLDLYDETPWEALKYLIADINYGGHVTDDWDRRLLQTYIQDYYNVDVVQTQFYKLSPLPHYYVPKDGPLATYKEYVSFLPPVDHPEVFGQHINADISAQIQETRRMFETLLLIQTSSVTSSESSSGAGGKQQEGKADGGDKQAAKTGADTKESVVLELGGTIKKQIPDNVNYEDTVQLLGSDISHPLNVVLLQEIQRYNNLLDTIRQHLTDLEKGIQGLVVMSSELEAIFTSLYEGRVPKMWEKAYSSMKPIASWVRDLGQRVEMFNTWATTTHAPIIFWLSAFTFPTGFLTAVLQTAARANNIPVDTLSWEFQVQTLDDSNLTAAPKEGVYVKGFYLQGAGWDKKNACLVEANPMQLVVQMPTIYFKPVENKKKTGKSSYVCPTYYYPNRAGATGRPSFVVAVELKAGEKPPEHWVKRGTGLLLSLDT